MSFLQFIFFKFIFYWPKLLIPLGILIGLVGTPVTLAGVLVTEDEELTPIGDTSLDGIDGILVFDLDCLWESKGPGINGVGDGGTGAGIGVGCGDGAGWGIGDGGKVGNGNGSGNGNGYGQ